MIMTTVAAVVVNEGECMLLHRETEHYLFSACLIFPFSIFSFGAFLIHKEGINSMRKRQKT